MTIECAEPEDFPRAGHQRLAKCHYEAIHSVFSCLVVDNV